MEGRDLVVRRNRDRTTLARAEGLGRFGVPALERAVERGRLGGAEEVGCVARGGNVMVAQLPLARIATVYARVGDLFGRLVQRMNDLADRATSHSYFLLKAGRRQRLTIEAWPYDQIDLTRFHELKNRALTRRPSEAGDC
jgi:hypothetical protein